MASFRSSVQHAAAATLLAIALACSSAAQTFPCGVVPPCVDDPTFEFSGFGCDSEIFAGCVNVIEPTVLEACALSCLTCPICEEPDVIPGFDVILQFDEVVPGSLSVFIKTSEALASVRGVIGCFSAGELIPVNITESEFEVGPAFTSPSFLGGPLPPGVGDFAIVNPVGGTVAPGYYQLATVKVDTETASFGLCDAGTLGIINATSFFSIAGELSLCGTYEDPCPVVDPSPPPVSLPGDIDLDGMVTVQDVVSLIAVVTGNAPFPSGAALANADLNSDGDLTIADVVLLIDIAVGN